MQTLTAVAGIVPGQDRLVMVGHSA